MKVTKLMNVKTQARTQYKGFLISEVRKLIIPKASSESQYEVDQAFWHDNDFAWCRASKSSHNFGVGKRESAQRIV
jgi:hypothetical protein